MSSLTHKVILSTLQCLLCLGLLCLGLLSQSTHANIPAAYLACEGADEGAECSLPGPQFGICVRDVLCDDIAETTVDECVLCVDGCWAGNDGDDCIRPWSGEVGICETQDRCTDPPETSFEECRRCVLPLDSTSDVDEHGALSSRSESCVQSSKQSRSLMMIFAWLLLISFVVKRARSASKS